MTKVTFPALLALAQANGADSILLLEPSKKADIKMRIMEKDGSESAMCGNGARVVSLFLKEKFGCSDPVIESRGNSVFETYHESSSRVTVNLGVADVIDSTKYLIGGEPHQVLLNNPGREFLLHQAICPSINSNLVEDLKDNVVDIRTFERGVNDFTKCCGTGSVATANFLRRMGIVDDRVEVISPGGSLMINFDSKGGSWMSGPAKIVN